MLEGELIEPTAALAIPPNCCLECIAQHAMRVSENLSRMSRAGTTRSIGYRMQNLPRKAVLQGRPSTDRAFCVLGGDFAQQLTRSPDADLNCRSLIWFEGAVVLFRG